MFKGKFIVFEGNEGTGKSTHIKFASDYLSKNSVSHIITREPGGTKLGESIRDILLNKDSELDAISEAILFYASRVNNYRNVILKALKSGQFVICDRFHYSTLVYQGIVPNEEKVIALHKELDNYFSEHISKIIYLDAAIDTCMKRIGSRRISDKFENQGRDFLVQVKSAYEKAFTNNNKVTTINTEDDKALVTKKIQQELDEIINE